MSKIERQDDGKDGKFVVYDNDEKAGELTYKWKGESEIIIDHTEVDEKFGGKGLGEKLVMKAVDYARQNNLKIHPHCPFANKVMQKDESTHDVLA